VAHTFLWKSCYSSSPLLALRVWVLVNALLLTNPINSRLVGLPRNWDPYSSLLEGAEPVIPTLKIQSLGHRPADMFLERENPIRLNLRLARHPPKARLRGEPRAASPNFRYTSLTPPDKFEAFPARMSHRNR